MKHPNQPVEYDDYGVIRFKKNKIVEYLLENGGIDLNQIDLWCAENNIDDNEKEQFAQLIVYSVRGYSGLSYVSDESWGEVEILAEKLRHTKYNTR